MPNSHLRDAHHMLGYAMSSISAARDALIGVSGGVGVNSRTRTGAIREALRILMTAQVEYIRYRDSGPPDNHFFPGLSPALNEGDGTYRP